jgi:hypothetical protein
MTIDEYLAELRRRLRAGPLAKRRILREVEAHLRDAAEREGDERAAVAAFGPAGALVGRFAPPRRIAPRVLFAALAAASTAAAIALGLSAVGGPHPTRAEIARLARGYCGGPNASKACLLIARRQIGRRPDSFSSR